MQIDGHLMRRYRDGEVAVPGYLTDYAFFALGLLDLYESTFEERWLEEAVRLTERMIGLYWDNEAGGFFFSGKYNERLITPTKEIYDGAVPSGNSIAALVLCRLGHITGNQQFQMRSEQLFNAFAGEVSQQPRAHTQLLIAYDYAMGPRREIVIAGERNDQMITTFTKIIHERFLPRTTILLHPSGDQGKVIQKLVPFINELKPINNKTTAYVCENYACNLPLTSTGELEKLLTRSS